MSKLLKKIALGLSAVSIISILSSYSVTAFAATGISEKFNTTKLGGMVIKNAITQEEEFIPTYKFAIRSKGAQDEAGYNPQDSGVKHKFVGGIVDTDDRIQVTNTTAFPYSAVCRLIATFSDGSTVIGSAAMNGDDVAVTAAHCIYSKDKGGWAKSVRIIPAANGSTMPYGYYDALAFTVPNEWREDTSYDYDYGIVKLSTAIGNTTGYFGRYWGTDSWVGKNVTLTGYPSDKNSTMWTMSGDISSCSTYGISYLIDTSKGQAGSPVYWYDSKNGYQIVGIHTLGSTSSNSATRMTYDMRQLIVYMDEM